MNWAFVPNKPSEMGLFAPGKGAKDFTFINSLMIKIACGGGDVTSPDW